MRQWCHSRVVQDSNSSWKTNPWNMGPSFGCWPMLWLPTVVTWKVSTGKHGPQIHILVGLNAWVIIGFIKPIDNFSHHPFWQNTWRVERLTCVGQCDQTILDTLLTTSKWMQKPDCHNSLMVAEIGISVKIPACWWQHGKINTPSTTCLLPMPLMRKNRRASPNDRGMAQRQNHLSTYCGCLSPVHEQRRQTRPHDNAKQIQKVHEMVQKSGHQTHGNQSALLLWLPMPSTWIE